MCTSLNFKTKDNFNFLARTLDLGDDIDETIFFVPRNHPFTFLTNGSTLHNKYAFIGMGTKRKEKVIFFDGINENGLMCASLLLESTKANKINKKKFNISNSTFVSFVLSQFSSIQEFVQELDIINIVCDKIFEGSVCAPLHWVIYDQTNKSIVIEHENGLKIYNNSLGVLSNAPYLSLQIKNLHKYSSINPKSENIGLPGDNTSKSRFVRAAYFKKLCENVEGETNGVSTVFNCLTSTVLQKRLDFEEEENASYTHTVNCMCCESLTYYYYTFGNRQIQAFCLKKEDYNSKNIKEYVLSNEQSINFRN